MRQERAGVRGRTAESGEAGKVGMSHSDAGPLRTKLLDPVQGKEHLQLICCLRKK